MVHFASFTCALFSCGFLSFLLFLMSTYGELSMMNTERWEVLIVCGTWVFVG